MAPLGNKKPMITEKALWRRGRPPRRRGDRAAVTALPDGAGEGDDIVLLRLALADIVFLTGSRPWRQLNCRTAMKMLEELWGCAVPWARDDTAGR